MKKEDIMIKYAVTFRKENEKLTSMCSVLFKSEAEAKRYIEADAKHVCEQCDGVDLRWIKPKTLDYYCVETATGVKLYWQYFRLVI